MEEKRRKVIRVNKILRPVSVWLLILLLQIVLNFDSACYLFNHSSYEKTTAVVLEEKTDLYLLIIPMVELQYKYNGTVHTVDKFFVIQPFFGLSSEKGSELSVYVNTLAPEYVIFDTFFFKNWLNWVLMAASICCILRIYKLIHDKIQDWKLKRGRRLNENKNS